MGEIICALLPQFLGSLLWGLRPALLLAVRDVLSERSPAKQKFDRTNVTGCPDAAIGTKPRLRCLGALETLCQVKQASHQRIKTVRFHINELPGIVKLRETGSRTVDARG